MNRPRVTRWLRITWTAFWGLAAVLLVALWVRSYNHHAMTQLKAISGNTVLTVEFFHGQIALVFSAPLPPGMIPDWLRDYPLQNEGKLPGIAGFAWVQSPKVGEVITFPFWFATLLVTMAGTAPWLRRQFAIAVALVAWATK